MAPSVRRLAGRALVTVLLAVAVLADGGPAPPVPPVWADWLPEAAPSASAMLAVAPPWLPEAALALAATVQVAFLLARRLGHETPATAETDSGPLVAPSARVDEKRDPGTSYRTSKP